MALDEKYPLALPRGTVLAGQYVIERALGQGGFGITYKATDHKTGQSVAVKEFFPDSMASRTTQTLVTAFPGERGESFAYGKGCFLQEAETLAEFIGNENIVRVYSYFEENGTAYFVMEFIEGTSFEEYIKGQGGKVPYGEAERILLPVIDALALVHAKGIVHRDVTPDNIYITNDGGVKLLDFGAARYSLGDKSRSLDVVLKHGFAPKEQYTRHGRQGAYTDVYTVGATFYFAVTGRRPPDSIDRLEEDDLIPPGNLGVKIASHKEEAILKAMSVQPSNRYQTMGEFRKALMGEGETGTQALSMQAQGLSMQAQGASMQAQGAMPQPQQSVFTAVQPIPMPSQPQSAEPQPQSAEPQPQSAEPQPQSAEPQPQSAEPQPQSAEPQPIPQPTPVPSQPIPAKGEEQKKKKWILPVGIGAGVVLTGALLSAVLLKAVVSSGKNAESEQVIASDTVAEPETTPANTREAPNDNNLLKGNTSDNISEYGQMVIYDGDIYMCYPGGCGLLKILASGDEWSWLEETGYIRCLSVLDDTIYYINTGTAYSISTDGSGKALLPELADVDTIATLWVTDGGYYYYRLGDGLVYVKKGSKEGEGYIECAGWYNGVTFLGGDIYYLKESDTGSALYRAKEGNLTETPEKLIGEGEIASCDRIVSDGEYIYGLYVTEGGRNFFQYDINRDSIVNTYHILNGGVWGWENESILAMNASGGYVYFAVGTSVVRFDADENGGSIEVSLVYELEPGENFQYMTVIEGELVVLSGWMSNDSDFCDMLTVVTADGSMEPIIFKDTDLAEPGAEEICWNMTKETNYDSSGEMKSYTVYEYDDNGNMTKRTSHDPSGDVKGYTVWEYDDNGNKTKSTSYDPPGEVASYHIWEYDRNGNMTKDEYYGSQTSYCYVYEYDSNGNMTKRTYYSPPGEMGNYYVFEYDVNGNKTKETCYDSPGEVRDYTVYEYDGNRNITKWTYYDSSGEVKWYTVQEYDVNGNMTKQMRCYGSFKGEDWYTVFEYDVNGNKTRETTYDSLGEVKQYKVYEYDSNGNMTKEAWYDSLGNLRYDYTVYEYDSNGNMTKEIDYDKSSGEVKSYTVYEYTAA